jgi:hypothetical protein
MSDKARPFFPSREEVARLAVLGIENAEYLPDGSIVRFSFRYQRTRIFVAVNPGAAASVAEDGSAISAGLGAWRISGNDIGGAGLFDRASDDTAESVRDRIIAHIESGRAQTGR